MRPKVWIAVCGAFALLALALNTGMAQEQIAPIDVRITRTKDADVTVDVQGTKYYLWDFTISPAHRKCRFHVEVTFIEFNHDTHIGGRISEARSIALKGVTCTVEKMSAKSLLRAPDCAYVLVEGPEAAPGKDLYLEGTFTWNVADGDVHFFREKGTKRVWKSVPPPKKEEKKK